MPDARAFWYFFNEALKNASWRELELLARGFPEEVTAFLDGAAPPAAQPSSAGESEI